MRNAAFYHPVSSGIAKGGRGGATAPPIVPKQFSRKVKIRGGIVVGGGVYILSTESQLHLYDENQFTWNY
jgi:hypothetical protein